MSGLQRWHLIVLVVVIFVIAAVLRFSMLGAMRRLASPGALLVSLIGLVIWWWGSGIGGLLLEEHVSSDSGDIKLRLGMTGSGLSLALEVLAGVLLALSAHSRNPI